MPGHIPSIANPFQLKKILIITYYWPPSGGSGVQRWMYFAKYLSLMGFEPVVLTVSEKYASYKHLDHSFLSLIENIRTVKTRSFEPLKLYSFFRTGNFSKGIPQGTIEKSEKGFFHKFSNYLRSNVFIPDARLCWNLFALPKARTILRQEKIEMIVSTGPPHSSHLIALQLKKEFCVKWIADFRDPWTEIYYNQDLNKSQSTIQKDSRLEYAVLTQANLVLTVGNKLKELLAKKLDKTQSNKIHAIYNGYDSDLMQQAKTETYTHFEITFIGLLTHNQPYQAIAKALQIFLLSHPSADIRLSLAGNITNDILAHFEHNLPGLKIVKHGYVSHERAIELMKNSHLLLNILAEMEHAEILISGKQMEYIATGNPIVCIGQKNGESAHILSPIENAEVFEKHEIDLIVKFIDRVYLHWYEGTPLVNQKHSDYIVAKSRFATGKQLAALLNSL